MATYTLGSFDYKGNKYIIKDTTYESLSAAQDSNVVSLVTRGEKYNWNNLYNLMVPLTQKGAVNGIAPLNENGTIDLSYLPELSKVEVTPIVESGTAIATLTIDDEDTTIYAPEESVSDVTVTQISSSGTKIATISVNGSGTDLYAPDPGSPPINTKNVDGTVLAPTSSNSNKAWATDAEGNPGWRDFASTGVTSITSGDGLSGGPITSSGTLKVDLLSYTKLSAAAPSTTTMENRTYPIVLDSAGHLAVNVPWSGTIYENKTAVQGGTDVSLVTTGEKYNWNNKVDSVVVTKTTPSGTKSGTITVNGIATDLFYDTNLRAGAENGTISADTTSGNTYLNLIENGSFKSGVHLVPGLNTSITSNAGGSVIISALSKVKLNDSQITLRAGDWVNRTQTIVANGVTSNNSVIVIPPATSSQNYLNSLIKCTAQGTNSLTFECVVVPTNDIVVNVLVLEEQTL